MPGFPLVAVTCAVGTRHRILRRCGADGVLQQIRKDGMRRKSLEKSLLLAASMLGATAFAADEPTGSRRAESRSSESKPLPESSVPTAADGLVRLDYQTIKIKGYPSIDLAGFHVLNRFTDWLYVGVGGHAPLFKGEYGGFMAFDATLQAEQKLFGNWSVVAGASLGGGGGGKTVEQSRIISGSGGFMKAYAGLGYRLADVTLGVQYSKIRFSNSEINGSQIGLYVQTPFSYSIAPYENTGRSFRSVDNPDPSTKGSPAEDDEVVFGLDNVFQIHPKGSYRQTVDLIDVQYNHFISRHYYLLFGGSVGYHGIVAYNQAYGGGGYKFAYGDRLSIRAQLALGSGGYAPERIDTGSGLLIFPKVAAEYKLSDNFGVLLSGGYLDAPRGSSKNWTVGTALAYHLSPNGQTPASAESGRQKTFDGLRIHLFQQTEFNVHSAGRYQARIRLLSGQFDQTISDNVYIPVQGSIAYNSYFGFPGYGELLAGIGVQSKYVRGDTFQTFAQLLVGPNVHGFVAKPALGLNLGLSDRLAIDGQVSRTLSLEDLGLSPKQKKFRATSVGLGLTYRFSRPDR